MKMKMNKKLKTNILKNRTAVLLFGIVVFILLAGIGWRKHIISSRPITRETLNVNYTVYVNSGSVKSNVEYKLKE